eukprot:scaffold81544_cov38-Prasinocladus_malaysianus.AAC.2
MRSTGSPRFTHWTRDSCLLQLLTRCVLMNTKDIGVGGIRKYKWHFEVMEIVYASATTIRALFFQLSLCRSGQAFVYSFLLWRESFLLSPTAEKPMPNSTFETH